MIDILNKHFQDSLHINKEQSGLVQFANYLAYFLMAIPAGLIARKFGYKGGILVGLTLIAAGAFWFVPATNIGAYWAFLLGLFIIASGMTCLESIANPYTTLLGATESGATRINIARRLMVAAGFSVRLLAASLSFPAAKDRTQMPAFTSLIWASAFLWPCCLSSSLYPRCRICAPRMKAINPPGKKISIKPSTGQMAAIGVTLAIVCWLLYFFIAPILQLVWTLLNLNQELFQPTKYGLLVVAFIAAFVLVSKNWDMFRRKHFTLGIATQFLYVAAQTGIFSFTVNYIIENDPGVTKLQASHWLGAMVSASLCLGGCAAVP